MPKARFSLECKAFDEYMAKLDKIGGTAAMKKGVENALIKSKEYVTELLDAAMAKPNLPAHGDYSSGGTADSINRDAAVEWQGMTGTIEIGFEFKESGMKSIFLMYGTKAHGTPRMSPVVGLYDAIYGNKTKSQIKKIQSEALTATIDEIMKE